VCRSAEVNPRSPWLLGFCARSQVRGEWRRERNWDPTFPEFVGANLPGGDTENPTG
jgi:hypothetical protein